MIKMQSLRRFLFPLSALFIFSLLSSMAASGEESESSIYEVLKLHGLPMGLLPKGVKNFSLDNSGKFEVHLDRACNAKFENELHYDMNVSGTLRYGRIDELSGISAQDLFLWFPVIEIRVDIPSSGLIYFDVGVVSKQFSLSSFETPRDCVAVSAPDLQIGRETVEMVSKIRSGKLRSAESLVWRSYVFVLVCLLVIAYVVLSRQSSHAVLPPVLDTICANSMGEASKESGGKAKNHLRRGDRGGYRVGASGLRNQ